MSEQGITARLNRWVESDKNWGSHDRWEAMRDAVTAIADLERRLGVAVGALDAIIKHNEVVVGGSLVEATTSRIARTALSQLKGQTCTSGESGVGSGAATVEAAGLAGPGSTDPSSSSCPEPSTAKPHAAAAVDEPLALLDSAAKFVSETLADHPESCACGGCSLHARLQLFFASARAKGADYELERLRPVEGLPIDECGNGCEPESGGHG